jgi:uridylate kinase
MPALTQPRWKRVVLKLSGEALAEKTGFGLDNDVLAQLAGELRDAREEFDVDIAPRAVVAVWIKRKPTTWE